MLGQRKTLRRRKNGTRKQSRLRIVGINFEAGKSIQHVRSNKLCQGYANIQIAMDAPFQGRVADEKVRQKKRSELQFNDYNEPRLIADMTKIFKHIRTNYSGTKLVVQIARGRSWESAYKDVIRPILDELKFNDVEIKSGYRRNNYWNPGTDPFVYVNIGMFAVLTDKNAVHVGEICNPVVTCNILSYDKEFVLSPIEFKFSDKKNILQSFPEFKKLYLYGIADDMNFVTPDAYDESAINKLVNKLL